MSAESSHDLNTNPEQNESVASKLRTLARDVRRLSPSIRDPERFHVDKDEAAHELERIAADLEGRR
jgi:hypothetical protein